jgi:hypothetical protein
LLGRERDDGAEISGDIEAKEGALGLEDILK